MTDNEYFRLGLQFVISLNKKGTKAKIADCARILRSNFYRMLKGQRPFPEKKRVVVARCLMQTVRDLERLGMDIAEGIEDSVKKHVVVSTTVTLPEMSSAPDLDVYAIEMDTLEKHWVGKAWKLDDKSIMAEFDKIPCYQARFVFMPKIEFEVSAPDGEDRAEDE